MTRQVYAHTLLALAGSFFLLPVNAEPPKPAVLAAATHPAPFEAQPAPSPGQLQESRPAAARDLFVTVGKSLVVDSPVNIQRVVVGNDTLAEAIAVNPREVLVNGKAVGETSLIVWQQGGNRLFFDLIVRPATGKLDAVRQEINKETGGQDVTVNLEGDTVFLRGTVKDLSSADRAAAIASTLGGKQVNLLNVNVPPTEAQILLKVRFADVDRAASLELGANIFSTGALNTPGTISTGQFGGPRVTPRVGKGLGSELSLADALNVFLFRPDLNLGITIKALQARNLLEILAEPNVLAINGKPASFLAGGEFPYPTLQGGGGGLGAVTIQFREFGVRINFTPTVTPRGTIRLQVTPEVSSLDFANGLVFQGFSIPALSTRRVQTEIELESGQSFAIAGLLDNRLTDTLDKIPGLGNIPLLGKIFQSKSIKKQNTELLVMVTPELVRPIPAGQKVPEVEMPAEIHNFKETYPRTPGMDVTGPVPVKPTQDTVPVEQLMEQRNKSQQGPGYNPAAPTWPPVMQFPPPAPTAPSPTPAAPRQEAAPTAR